MSKLIFYNFRGRGGVGVVRGEGWYYFFENLELPSCVLLAFESVVTAFIQKHVHISHVSSGKSIAF